ncbi:hypothetical protein M0804_009255 [Polistes exclamans]|nr:hypothetical protein M0804_009255 [Polistes exclamans]
MCIIQLQQQQKEEERQIVVQVQIEFYHSLSISTRDSKSQTVDNDSYGGNGGDDSTGYDQRKENENTLGFSQR